MPLDGQRDIATRLAIAALVGLAAGLEREWSGHAGRRGFHGRELVRRHGRRPAAREGRYAIRRPRVCFRRSEGQTRGPNRHLSRRSAGKVGRGRIAAADSDEAPSGGSDADRRGWECCRVVCATRAVRPNRARRASSSPTRSDSSGQRSHARHPRRLVLRLDCAARSRKGVGVKRLRTRPLAWAREPVV